MENTMEHLEIDGAVIEYEVHGEGEPVLLSPVSVIGDGLGRPVRDDRRWQHQRMQSADLPRFC